MAGILETKPLIPRAQFLTGEAIPCPGDSLEAIRGNILATRFAHAVSSTGATCKRPLNFLQRTAAQICSGHGDILLKGLHRKFHLIGRLHICRERFRFTPRRSQNLIALLHQKTSIYLVSGLYHCTLTSFVTISFRFNPIGRTGNHHLLDSFPCNRMFQIISRLHNFLKFFTNQYSLIFQ